MMSEGSLVSSKGSLLSLLSAHKAKHMHTHVGDRKHLNHISASLNMPWSAHIALGHGTHSQ